MSLTESLVSGYLNPQEKSVLYSSAMVMWQYCLKHDTTQQQLQITSTHGRDHDEYLSEAPSLDHSHPTIHHIFQGWRH